MRILTKGDIIPYNKNMCSSPERRDHLVVKMFSGASLLNDLFDQVIYEKADPGQATERLSKRYEITDNQRRYLDTTVSRLIRAKEVVGKLEDRYGVDKKGVFRDKEALYRDVYDDDPPQKFSARSQQVAIEFTLPEDYFKSIQVNTQIGTITGQYAGLANRLDIPIDDQLDAILEEETFGDKDYSLLWPFVVKLNPNPSYSIQPNTLANRLKVKMTLLLAGGISIKEARRHEMRHVINHLLGYEGDLEELSAYSYAAPFVNYVNRVRSGVYFDSKSSEFSIKQTEIHTPEFLTSVQGLLIDLYRGGFDRKALSYIISTTDSPKLLGRLRLLKDYGFKNYYKKYYEFKRHGQTVEQPKQPVETDQNIS